MIFWLVNFIVLSSYAFFTKIIRKEKVFLYLSMTHLGILSALRGMNVGTDTRYYALAYHYLGKHNSLYRHAMSSSKVFLGLMKTCAKLYPKYNGYMIITTFLFFLIMILFFKEYSNNVYISVYLFIFMFFYFHSMNTARQYLAIACTFVVFMLADKNKMILAVLAGMGAVGIHAGVLPCVLICLFVSTIKWTPRITLMVMAIMYSIKILFPVFFNLFITLLPQYYWMKKRFYSAYLTSKGRSSLVFAVYGTMAIIGGLYVIYRNVGKIKIMLLMNEADNGIELTAHEMQLYQRWLIQVSFSTAIYMFYAKSIVLNRVASISYIYVIVLLSNVISHIDKKARVVMWILLMPLIPFTVLQIQQGVSNVLDYSFFVS